MKKILLVILLSLATFTGCYKCDRKPEVAHKVAVSADGERIAYNVYGNNPNTLIFIHGWSCDSRYWQKQINEFSKDYTVITIDLAGHGNSSANREDYTMTAFAYDIKSVIEKEKIQKAILIGHSMGGIITAEAARLLPETIIALIPIDTFQDVNLDFSKQAYDEMVSPFEVDFEITAKGFVASMFPKDADKVLLNWVQQDMSSANQKAALSSFKIYLNRFVDKTVAPTFKDINIPIYSIAARLWPTNKESNEQHIKNYTLVYVENTGHFPMLEDPAQFNKLLKEAVETILKK